VLDIQHGRIPRGIVNRDVLEKPNFRRKLEEYRRRFAN
jgi:hypothetical protein